MEKIKEYLAKNILLADGAMGTYYSDISDKTIIFPEYANIKDGETIKKIHKEYIDAGAKLIRTNTFSANRYSLKLEHKEIKKIINTAYDIAKECAGEDVYVAASIGPIPENIQIRDLEKEEIFSEYKFICDCFIEKGADIFIFETFGEYEIIKDVQKYIKSVSKEVFIMTSFSVNASGISRKGKGVNTLIKAVYEAGVADICGFNCGTGPKHLSNNIKKADFMTKGFSIMPNSGFPEVINERTVYFNNPKYFSELTSEFADFGAKIIGGCCGTTPEHIKLLKEKLIGKKYTEILTIKDEKDKKEISEIENNFMRKNEENKFIFAVELDPPFGSDLTKIINGGKFLKEKGADIITIADSPLGKVRNNPVMTAARVMRESGIDSMPHLACRDRNVIGLKADVMAGYAEGIRNILIVTGDPIPDGDRTDIKSVFNLNSIRFMELVRELEREMCGKKMFGLGAALNLNVANRNQEIKRMDRKIEAGADYFFTQPLYDDESIESLIKVSSDKKTKIFAGIMPFVSYRNAKFVANEIPGMKIPGRYVEMFKENMMREEAEKIGIEIVTKICKDIKSYVDGFYFIAPFNRYEMIGKIMDNVK